MDFPGYVPPAVVKHITALVDGDSIEPFGWAKSLENAEHELRRIDGAIASKTKSGEHEYLGSLRRQRMEAVEHRDLLAGEVSCLHRLANDPRMFEAIEILTPEFTNDDQWRAFFGSARAARMDYGKVRQKIRRATELSAEIADAAEGLRHALLRFAECGTSAPSEFFSVAALLRATDNHEMQDHNLSMWRSRRKYVLGDYVEGESQRVGSSAADPMAAVRYGWGVAPDLPELLTTLSHAARAHVPAALGISAVALASRQSSVKTEYLRAFGNLLGDVHRLDITATVMRAMAVAANVVINDQEIDVSYDDVRKALLRTKDRLDRA